MQPTFAASELPIAHERRGVHGTGQHRLNELAEENVRLERENRRLQRTIAELRLKNILLEEHLGVR